MEELQQFFSLLLSLQKRDLALIIIFILVSACTILFSAYYFFCILSIHQKRFAEKMDFVEIELRREAVKMFDRMKKTAEERFSLAYCPMDSISCGFIMSDYHRQIVIGDMMIRDVFLEKTRKTMKTRFRQNGFYNKKGIDLQKYKETKGVKIYNDNVDTFSAMGINNHNLLEIKERGRLYTAEEAIESYGRMIDEAIRIHKKEKKEIIRVVFFLKNMFFDIVKNED